ncbi:MULTISPECIES: TetR/AcrR family transcriptional regulator [Leeia]|uniref:TetR/AcrR family transcriptional regulator n=1 Tax=Leeia aquatica TaxID=2725557 RepID=A0A847S7S0_9NEIS|nr:TetR/AcrR family transcriptional regulator [Leeia aquatica]NLR75994.1 TetR/AcrR family transcriptional regulator [Leeia aquatica]
MARPRRNIELVRQKILEEAKATILELGWESLTMVTLAKRLNMSVGNLYKFFDSKDELFLAIFTDFHAGLNQQLQDHLHEESLDEPHLGKLIDIYFHYANSQFHLYELVMHPPILYKDFVDTPLQPMAEDMRKETLRTMDLGKRAVAGALRQKGVQVDERELVARFVYFFNSVHGLLLTMHSRIMPYILFEPDAMIPLQLAMIQKIVLSSAPFSQELAAQS